MSLQSGQMLSHYRLVEKIGEGGMGVVWKAEDMKLGRQVAIKILPVIFANDTERMARFSREAQVLAALNHPHVAAIYGLEEQGPLRGLVLELVDGETLADRIARGPLTVDESLRLAAQIAEAMEAAHETGTVHRDLKPANVKITEKGSVKVLDFGLAKALIGDPAASPNTTQSPTITASPTQAGIILGTASYMSPEQARGRNVDRRSDVWSFGVILFEMLTGQRLFAGETITDVLAAVVRAEPDWEKLPAPTPPAVRRLLRRCLSKDPGRRLRDFGDVLLEIREADDEPPAGTEVPAALPAARRSVLRRFAGPAAALILAAATAVGGWMLAGSSSEEPNLTASILPPEGTRFELSLSTPGAPVLSPDGAMLAFTAADDQGERAIYVRPLASREAYRLTGTENSQYPFWSPDSRYLGFFTQPEGKLKKIPVSGGPPIALCDAENGKGGAWSSDGTIVFTPAAHTPLFKVRETGGVPTPLTELDTAAKEDTHRHPFFLPGGRRLLFFIHRAGTDAEAADRIAAVGVDGGPITPIMNGSYGATYASGHLLFVRDGTLMAQPFDPESLALSGEPVPLAEHVGTLAGAYKAVFTASSDGRLAFVANVGGASRNLMRIDRTGAQRQSFGTEGDLTEISLSPDGTRAALSIGDPVSGRWDIWIQDLGRDLRTRLTLEPGDESSPVWSPDGKRIYYSSEPAGNIKVKNTDGSGEAEVAVEWDRTIDPSSVSPDGKWLVAQSSSPETNNDIWSLPLQGGGNAERIVGSRFVDVDGKISPDGRWMVYMSMESGRAEIYLTTFPKVESKWQVSASGGENPLWSHHGRKVVYQDLRGMITEVPVAFREGVPVLGRPSAITAAPVSPVFYRYTILPDGQFLVIQDTKQAENPPATLILNWPRMLEDRGRRPAS